LSDPITYPQPTQHRLTPLQPPTHTTHTPRGGGDPGRPQGFFEITVSRRQIQISRKSFSRFEKFVFEINDFSEVAQLFSNCNLDLYFFGSIISAQKLYVERWWNCAQVSHNLQQKWNDNLKKEDRSITLNCSEMIFVFKGFGHFRFKKKFQLSNYITIKRFSSYMNCIKFKYNYKF